MYSAEECTMEMCYIHAVEYYLAVKKDEIMTFKGKWMWLEIIILREATRPRKTNIMFLSLVYGYHL